MTEFQGIANYFVFFFHLVRKALVFNKKKKKFFFIFFQRFRAKTNSRLFFVQNHLKLRGLRQFFL